MKRSLLVVVGSVLGVVLLGVVALAVAISLQPDRLEVERSVVIQARAEQIHAHLVDYRAFVAWSPWTELDPDQTTTFSEPSGGEGAWYTWDGNDDVGAGRMDMVRVEPMRIEQTLAFTRPFESEATVVYTLMSQDEGTRVTWSMEQDTDLVMKAFMLAMDFDALVGADFDKGLAKLEARVESMP